MLIQVSNILRVPFELIKQRSQANRHKSPLLLLQETLRSEVDESSLAYILHSNAVKNFMIISFVSIE